MNSKDSDHGGDNSYIREAVGHGDLQAQAEMSVHEIIEKVLNLRYDNK